MNLNDRREVYTRECHAAEHHEGRLDLNECRQTYYESSGKASDLNRSLCYSGIAIIWVFRMESSSGGAKIPDELFLPGFFIVLSLVFDFAQYAVKATSWAIFAYLKERHGISEEASFDAPEGINWVPIAAYYSKFVFIAVAYVLLLRYLSSCFV